MQDERHRSDGKPEDFTAKQKEVTSFKERDINRETDLNKLLAIFRNNLSIRQLLTFDLLWHELTGHNFKYMGRTKVLVEKQTALPKTQKDLYDSLMGEDLGLSIYKKEIVVRLIELSGKKLE